MNHFSAFPQAKQKHFNILKLS